MWKGRHVAEPTQLLPDEATGFWSEVTAAAAVIEERYRPVKMNWMSLGNWVPHLHVHLVPRYEDDVRAGQPIEAEAFTWAQDHPVPDDELREEAEALRRAITGER
jgi:diadenosine tetraphosphate (Ap4A) HIT family hydrolase